MIDAWIEEPVCEVYRFEEAAYEWAEKKYRKVEKELQKMLPDSKDRDFFLNALATSYGMNNKLDEEIERRGMDSAVAYYILDDSKGLVSEFQNHCYDY